MPENIFLSCIRADAEYRKLLSALRERTYPQKLPLLLTGLCEGAQELLCTAIQNDLPDARPVLLLCPDEKSCFRFARILHDFGKKCVVFPARDYNFHSFVASREYERARIAALCDIQNGSADTVLATPDALLGYTVPPEVLSATRFAVTDRSEISPAELEIRLVKAGFSRAELAEGPGQFARRGGIVDIVTERPKDTSAAPDSDDARGIYAVRIEFFGDEIDRIGRYDSATQRVTENISSFEIAPAKEVIPDAEALGKIRDCIRGLLRKAENKDVRAALESELSDVTAAIESGAELPFADKYISLVYPQKATLMSYLEDCGLICAAGNAAVRERLRGFAWQIGEDTKKMVESLQVPGKYAGYAADAADFTQFCRGRITLLTDLFGQGMSDRELGGLYGFSTKHSLSASVGDEMLLEDVQTLIGGKYRIVLMAENAGQAKAYEKKLTDAGILSRAAEQPDGSDVPLSLLQPASVLIVPAAPILPFELVGPRIAVLSLSDEKHAANAEKKKPKLKKSAAKRILSFNELHVGDYVVHENHGIGRYDGISTLTVDGVTKDYITIQYEGSDKLFIPADSLDKISKYIGAKSDDAGVKLSKFGGAEWGRTKARAKSALRNIAKELIQLYAERSRRPGFAFLPDDSDQKRFEDAFAYEMTDAQTEALNEIKGDMMKAVPMDRLLCGDVGYGKTEVALRAAYKAILSGKQAVMLVPTTILALQHFETAQARFRGTGVSVAMLSRFVKPKEQKRIMDEVRRGTVDLLIGTHRLLSKDLEFKRLGLLIVDEEQRFGVAQKEKIKQRTANVDVLSLSATPIPRTLNMAMSGIRDISVLDEAPGARLPVQTYVLEHNDAVITEAIRRELRRGGQVFYLYNFVESIDALAGKIREAIPEATVVTAHGKMDKEQLEDIWKEMTEGKIDVLVSTTIIESGVDVPNANTLIVQNAHRLGLSQLHQLRGRVGRSPRRAYAYFTFPPGKALSEISEKRLEAIREYAEFGAGFQIAMRDLELRGAGSVLGAEQSGHLDDIGYDLYIKMLNEAILEEKGETPAEAPECKISLSVSAFLPESYIRSAPQRMAVYKRLAGIETAKDADDITDELLDRYGELPDAVQNLVDVALLRSRAAALGITDIAQEGKEIRIRQQKFDAFAWQDVRAFVPGKMKILLNPVPCVLLTVAGSDSVIAVTDAVLTKFAEAQKKNSEGETT